MRAVRVIPIGMLIVLAMGVLVWLGRLPDRVSQTGAASMQSQLTGTSLRLGLVPERDIFTQRKMYRALADYLEQKLHRPVQLVTANRYQGVLEDFEERRVDMAFLGSLVAVLAADRLDAKVLLKPELEGNVSTYRAVLFVPEDSPIKRVEDLAGRKVAMVPTTLGGSLFAVHEMVRRGMLDRPDAPKIVRVGTHDEVILEVLEGRADAGAVKDLRLDAFEKFHGKVKLRRLAMSEVVPENALVMRSDLAAELGPTLRRVLLEMDKDEQGRLTLREFGAARFVPCEIGDYKTIYDLVDRLGSAWEKVGVIGPPPKRPTSLPSAAAP